MAEFLIGVVCGIVIVLAIGYALYRVIERAAFLSFWS